MTPTSCRQQVSLDTTYDNIHAILDLGHLRRSELGVNEDFFNLIKDVLQAGVFDGHGDGIVPDSVEPFNEGDTWKTEAYKLEIVLNGYKVQYTLRLNHILCLAFLFGTKRKFGAPYLDASLLAAVIQGHNRAANFTYIRNELRALGFELPALEPGGFAYPINGVSDYQAFTKFVFAVFEGISPSSIEKNNFCDVVKLEDLEIPRNILLRGKVTRCIRVGDVYFGLSESGYSFWDGDEGVFKFNSEAATSVRKKAWRLTGQNLEKQGVRLLPVGEPGNYIPTLAPQTEGAEI